MIDHLIMKVVRRPIHTIAKVFHSFNIPANLVTIVGFLIGFTGFICIAQDAYIAGLVCIFANRFLDGIDGELARLVGATDRGAYLDIMCDFLFYSFIVLGFAIADPFCNGLAAAVLLTGFMGTSASFLIFAIMAERRKLNSLAFPQKGFYYLGGLTEGFETIIFFTAFCLFPHAFFYLAIFFASLCFLTTAMRIHYAYKVLG